MSVLRLHYFLWFGSLSGIMPFISIFAQEHSVANAEDVGLLFFVLPFIVSVVKPLFCSIADRNNCHRKFLIISIVLTIFGYGFLLTTIFINFGVFSWYWFCILVLFANSGQGVVISLTDYLVMKEVTELNKNYGEYRVFGTLGWGGFGVIAGIINEYIKQLPYLLPGLLMFIVIEILDLFCIVFKLKQINSESKNNLEIIENVVPERKTISTVVKKPFIATIKSLIHLFRIFRNNPSLLQYITIILVFGALTAFHWTYYFWFLQEIRGKDPLLMGLALLVQSFAGELPIFIIANQIMKYCGPSMSLNISLSAFAIRYFIYGFAFEVGTAYWDVLLVEVVQGLTFSLFYTVMTDLAQHYANRENQRFSTTRKMIESIEGSEIQTQSIVDERPEQNSYATMQGLMSGAFEGIGLGVGALVGGYIVNRRGVFSIWRIGAYISCAAILFNIAIDLIKYFLNRNSRI